MNSLSNRSYATAASPGAASPDPFEPKTFTRPAGQSNSRVSNHHAVTHHAAICTVKYMKAIYGFVKKLDDSVEGPVYRIPGFMPPGDKDGHELARAAHASLLEAKNAARLQHAAEGDDPTPESKSREYTTRHQLVGWSVYRGVCKTLFDDPTLLPQPQAPPSDDSDAMCNAFKLIFPRLTDPELNKCVKDSDLQGIISRRLKEEGVMKGNHATVRPQSAKGSKLLALQGL